MPVANKVYNPILNNYPQEILMKTNEGSTDRILRVIVGLVLLGLTLSGYIGVWGWIGVVPLVTGALGMCPLYTLLGLNTCQVKSKG